MSRLKNGASHLGLLNRKDFTLAFGCKTCMKGLPPGMLDFASVKQSSVPVCDGSDFVFCAMNEN